MSRSPEPSSASTAKRSRSSRKAGALPAEAERPLRSPGGSRPGKPGPPKAFPHRIDLCVTGEQVRVLSETSRDLGVSVPSVLRWLIDSLRDERESPSSL